MAITVAVIVSRKFRARAKVCPDLIAGVKAVGDKVIAVRSEDYAGVVSDVAMFYGFDGSRQSRIARAFEDYKRAGKKAVYIDLGYFNDRVKDGRYGYHRFSVNARHPTAYFQNVKHPGDRFRVHGRKIEPWKANGKNILLCGMSQKCAAFEGFAFEQWERAAIKKIKAVTARPIVYRPKPKRNREPPAPPIEGVGYSDPRTSIHSEFRNAWAVVSHHSNAGIDALLAGVPSFSDEGVATALGQTDLALIEQRNHPSDEERIQFANDIAYCQFNREEMRNGTAWYHLKNEGLV